MMLYGDASMRSVDVGSYGGAVAGGEVGDLTQFDFVATSGRRFSRVRVAQGPVVKGNGTVIAAGTHSDPANCVSVWNSGVACDMRLADALLNHEVAIEDKYSGAPERSALTYKVDGDVSALEFCGELQKDDATLRLCVGTSKGVVSLLCAQRYEDESDGQGGHIEAWKVSHVATARQKPDARPSDTRPLHSQAASALAALPSGLDVLSAGEDGLVWSLNNTGAALVPTLIGRADPVAIYDIKFADMTGDKFVTAGAASGLRLCSRRGGESEVYAGDRACPWTAVEIVKDRYVLAGRDDGQLALFDTRRGGDAVAVHWRGDDESVGAADTHAYHDGGVTAVRRGPDNDFLSSARDGTVLQFEIREAAVDPFAVSRWCHHTQAVNDVAATKMHRGLRHESTFVVAASDASLLITAA